MQVTAKRALIQTIGLVRLWILLLLVMLPWNGPTWGMQEAASFDSKQLNDSIESIATTIDREYFDPAIGSKVASLLRQKEPQKDYRSVKTWQGFAESLNRDLYRWTQDKHLAVSVVPSRPTEADLNEPEASREAVGRRCNYGIQRIEILPGNIGYLNVTAFYRLEEGKDAIAAAMQVLRGADALIIDVRNNGGGSPDTVVLLASYLFDESNLELFEIVPRSQGETRKYRTMDVPTMYRNAKRPVYVLTSHQTFSGGEGFAYLLQERGRAMVIGETTAGAANPGRPYPVHEFLEVTVPNGQIRTAVTRKNWEGHGVVPDLPLAVAEAPRMAQRLALKKLLEGNLDQAWSAFLRSRLESLESSTDPIVDQSNRP